MVGFLGKIASTRQLEPRTLKEKQEMKKFLLHQAKVPTLTLADVNKSMSTRLVDSHIDSPFVVCFCSVRIRQLQARPASHDRP
jgi:hypothetical protein